MCQWADRLCSYGGHRNNLREDTHYHHCRLWVPGLQIHVIFHIMPLIAFSRWQTQWLFPCEEFKPLSNRHSSNLVVLEHCQLHVYCHTYRKGHSMPLRDLEREFLLLLRRSFVTFHLANSMLSSIMCQRLTSLQRWKKCSFHERKMLSQQPFSGFWLLPSFQRHQSDQTIP